ncbi:hypothetical protein ABZ746_23670 [Streptomyces sp. NPDC020096]
MSTTASDYVRTAATVLRAGEQTALVVLPAWHGGNVLARVATWELSRVTGRLRADLPGLTLSVLARLDALLDDQLDLHDWRIQERCAA